MSIAALHFGEPGGPKVVGAEWRCKKLLDWGYSPSRRMYSLDMRHMFSTTVAPGFTLPGVSVFLQSTELLKARSRPLFY